MYGTFDWNTVGGKNFLTSHLMAQAFAQVTARKPPPRKVPRVKHGEPFLSAYAEGIEEHRRKLRKRGFVLAAEHIPPVGQALLWYHDVIHFVPPSGARVARQIARLAGEDSQVTIPYRSLSDAVGWPDKAGREYAYMQRGVQALVDSGWLTVETVGEKRGAKTTFYLQVGDLNGGALIMDEGFGEDEFLDFDDVL
ncbi:hypothetical protein [Streptomyces caniscabiei]|uniref:hypothetical protein n=1 Tax=Streptomyces caniscabiei TaxID=2746961 RepID=UPI0029AF65EE|nr:hypothetical protein [Streptomyces caniscabiei]MDX2736398.1 hypothetical protein [Streptomyces caniscabiei]